MRQLLGLLRELLRLPDWPFFVLASQFLGPQFQRGGKGFGPTRTGEDVARTEEKCRGAEDPHRENVVRPLNTERP